jgi:hypothetical protein
LKNKTTTKQKKIVSDKFNLASGIMSHVDCTNPMSGCVITQQSAEIDKIIFNDHSTLIDDIDKFKIYDTCLTDLFNLVRTELNLTEDTACLTLVNLKTIGKNQCSSYKLYKLLKYWKNPIMQKINNYFNEIVPIKINISRPSTTDPKQFNHVLSDTMRVPRKYLNDELRFPKLTRDSIVDLYENDNYDNLQTWILFNERNITKSGDMIHVQIFGPKQKKIVIEVKK